MAKESLITPLRTTATSTIEPSATKTSPEPPKRSRWKRVFNRKTVLVTVILAAIAGVLYWNHLQQSVIVARSDSNVPLALTDNKLTVDSLIKDGDSRLNIMLLGQGGQGHDGPDLTDTMQVLSLDLINKQAALLSIPRDLYVKSPYGYMKINALYQSANATKANSGGQAVKDFVGGITDLKIHYFLAMDFDGFKALVDLLGGLDIKVVNPINDYEYPNATENGLVTFKLAAGLQHMNGDTALKYVRSRHSSGVEGSDFARSARQQLAITAIRDKASSLGYFKNPVKFVQITNLLSKYVKTDITPSEMKLLADRLSGITDQGFKTGVLSNSPEGLLIDGAVDNAGYTLTPRAGLNDYHEIAGLIHSLAPDPLITKEAAKVRVLSTTAKAKLAASTVATLRQYGYTVSDAALIGGDQKATKQVQLIDYRAGDHPYSVNYLTHRFSAVVTTSNASSDVDIDIILAQ